MTDLTPHVLALEAAVAGGSLALLSDGGTKAAWHSPDGEARSEELLLRVSEMLHETEVGLEQISHIAVSRGPGSYTGIRIGLATAMGLAGSLQIPAKGILLLPAIAESLSGDEPKISVVPMGRNGFSWQQFDLLLGRAPEAGTGDLQRLISVLRSISSSVVVAQSGALDALRSTGYEHPAGIVDAGKELAVHIGRSSLLRDEGLEPFYARSSHFARSDGK